MNLVLIFAPLALLSWVLAGLWFNERIFTLPRRKLASSELLSRWLQSWQLIGLNGQALSQLGAIPEYKFFSRLAQEGLRQARTFGSFPRELIWEWRDGIAREKAFEERLKSVFLGAWVQFFIFTLICWLLVKMTASFVNTLPVAIFVLMIALQISGFALFSPILNFLMKYKLAGFAELLESLYVLRTLSAASLPTSRVLAEAKIERVQLVKNLALSPLKERVQDLATTYQKQGGALGREAQILLQECWFLREEGMQKLLKTAEALKLVFLLCFFAGAYFVFLSALIFEVLRSS